MGSRERAGKPKGIAGSFPRGSRTARNGGAQIRIAGARGRQRTIDPLRLYRFLLRLYPARFREEYRAPLEQQARDEDRDSSWPHAAGAMGVAAAGFRPGGCGLGVGYWRSNGCL